MEPSDSLTTKSNAQTFHKPIHTPIILANPSRTLQTKKTSLSKLLLLHHWKVFRFRDHLEEISRLGPNKRFLKVLKSQKLLSKFIYSLNSNRSFNNPDLFAATKGFQMISSLELYFSYLYKQNIKSRNRTLFASLSSLKNLANLKIVYFPWKPQNLHVLQNLLKILKRIKKIASLSLNFDNYSDRFIPSLSTLSSHLSKLTQLRTLSLTFFHIYDEKDIPILALLLSQLRWLTQISITFESLDSIQNSTLLQLFESFENLKALSSLSLNFSIFKIINQKHTESFSEGLKFLNFTLMRKLSLSFYENLSDAKLIKFSHILKEFTSITILNLEFNHCYSLTNAGVSELCNTLSSLVLLESLTLRFYPKAKNGSTIPNVAFAVKSLLNLVNLEFSCPSSRSTEDEDIQQLFINIMALKSLKFLSLHLDNEAEITDYSIASLCQSLNELAFLRNLKLNFACAKFITNRGVEALMNAVQNLRNLSELTLIFRRDHPLDKKTANKVRQALKNLSYLFNCHVSFPEKNKGTKGNSCEWFV